MRTGFIIVAALAAFLFFAVSVTAQNNNNNCSGGCGSCETCKNGVCAQDVNLCQCQLCWFDTNSNRNECRIGTIQENNGQDFNGTCPTAINFNNSFVENSGGGEGEDHGAIIGGVVGGVVGGILLLLLGILLLALLAGLIAAALARRRRRRAQPYGSNTRGAAAVAPVGAERGARTNPFGPGATAAAPVTADRVVVDDRVPGAGGVTGAGRRGIV